MHCVKETSRGLAFPWNIPRKRGSMRKIAIVGSSLMFLLLGCFLAEGNCLLFLGSSASAMLLTLCCVELISRFCALLEEIQHFRSRYDGQIRNLFQDTFSMSRLSYTFVLSGFICNIIYFTTNRNPFEIVFNDNANWLSGLAVIISAVLVHKVLKLEQSPLNQSLQFDELQGCDYGSGMANSFFHGYLRIMLPHTGRENDKGLREFQQDYEARNDIKFDAYKLFILIPMSQHCPPSLGSEFSPSVEPCKELECKEVDRAGVKNRNYKNSVYRIYTKSKDENREKVYVSAEYATPVKTLGEVMKQNTASGQLYMKHRKEILLNFYLTLRDLLKGDEECCNLCEVIYYDDKNEKGQFRDVGEVILSRLKHIMKKND